MILARFLTLFAALVIVAACETAGQEDLTSETITTGSDREDITASGPLSEIYDQDFLPGPELGTQADLVTSVGDRVFFGTDRYDLSSEARSVLEGQANWLLQYPNITATIEGHADERGTREYNLALGERRANSVKNYLVALGVDPRRLTTISYGKERPAVVGSNESAWAQNRRSVTKVD